MESTRRRRIGRLIQLGIVLVALIAAGSWLYRRITFGGRVQLERPPAQTTELQPLGEGDMRIFTTDSAVVVSLVGDRVLAGLSEQLRERIRSDMERDRPTDGGLGGSIADAVTRTVSSALETQAAIRLADLREVRYERGQIVLAQERGGAIRFPDGRGRSGNSRFEAAEVERLAAAVRARKAELGIR